MGYNLKAFELIRFSHFEKNQNSDTWYVTQGRKPKSSILFLIITLEQNEEALKKCAQDYLARVKQEEQRYQALKIHAEEKLDK